MFTETKSNQNKNFLMLKFKVENMRIPFYVPLVFGLMHLLICYDSSKIQKYLLIWLIRHFLVFNCLCIIIIIWTICLNKIMRYSENYKKFETKNRGSTPHLFSSTSVFPGDFRNNIKIKREVRRTCLQVPRTFMTKSSQKTFILFIMIKPIHLLISECLLMLLECKISFSFVCTNILMVYLMLCCQMLEMDPNSSIGRMCLDKGNCLAENDQVETEETWQGAVTFDITDMGKKNKQRIHIFHRMETDECYMKFITPCHVENIYTNDVMADLDYSRNYMSKELMKRLGLGF